jgi:undecaprenyl-diphosphatase
MLSAARRYVGKLELWSLVALALVAGGVAGFVQLADEVSEGATQALDSAALLALRQPGDLARPIGPAWLPDAVRDITALGSTVVLSLLTLAALGYLLLLRRTHMAALLAVAMVGGTALSSVLKAFFERPRPDIVPALTNVTSLSFPSGHSMMSAVAYLTIAVLIGRSSPSPAVRLYLVVVAVLITVLVGLSRIYLGVHWPSDVLAGWCGGAAWALACWLVARRLQRRGQVEQAGPAPDVVANHGPSSPGPTGPKSTGDG